MNPKTILWHDYETSGLEPDRARPLQFAAIRTSEDLKELDEIEFRAELAPEVLPDPVACLVTGVVPGDHADEELSELEFARRIRREMLVEGTCVVGYNSAEFDAEFTRFLFWRCLLLPVFDPEWRGGNTRWDLIDPLRAAYALRPSGIEWPRRDDGKPSFRLADLAEANGIDLGDAHDALVDVRVTIEMARLLKRAQPRLYQYLYHGRLKSRAVQRLDRSPREPLVHTSNRISADVACTSVIVPVAQLNSTQFATLDLRYDPQILLDEDTANLRRWLYTSREQLPPDTPRVGIKKVHTNRAPVLAPLDRMDEECWARVQLDPNVIMTRWALVQKHMETLSDIASDLCKFDDAGGRPEVDPESSLYAGFPSDADVSVCQNKVHERPPEEWRDLQGEFEDDRLGELLFRLRCREAPETLSEDERSRWSEHLRSRLLGGAGMGGSRADQVRKEIERLKDEHANDSRSQGILARIGSLVDDRTRALG